MRPATRQTSRIDRIRASGEVTSRVPSTAPSASTVVPSSPAESPAAATAARTSVWKSAWCSQTRRMTEAFVTRMPVSDSTRSRTRLKVRSPAPIPRPSSRRMARPAVISRARSSSLLRLGRRPAPVVSTRPWSQIHRLHPPRVHKGNRCCNLELHFATPRCRLLPLGGGSPGTRRTRESRGGGHPAVAGCPHPYLAGGAGSRRRTWHRHGRAVFSFPGGSPGSDVGNPRPGPSREPATHQGRGRPTMSSVPPTQGTVHRCSRRPASYSWPRSPSVRATTGSG